MLYGASVPEDIFTHNGQGTTFSVAYSATFQGVNVLKFNDVSLQLGGKPILKPMSGGFPQGSITALIGPNGSGKSTLADNATSSPVTSPSTVILLSPINESLSVLTCYPQIPTKACLNDLSSLPPLELNVSHNFGGVPFFSFREYRFTGKIEKVKFAYGD